MVCLSRGIPRSSSVHPARRLAAALVSVVLAGCGGAPSRPIATTAQLRERGRADATEMGETFHRAVASLVARTEERAKTSGGEPPVLNILAMSGGGDYGAFGAGVLVGWGQATDRAWRRPEFDAVTGVSTGAMLSPFAFVGTDESCLQVETFYRNPKPDWVEDRGLLFFLPYNPSFMMLPGLTRDIKAAVDAPFVARIAEESRKGRLLLVSATDLDYGRQKIWEVGAEAQKATDAAGVERVRQILLASAAIPAIFPSVIIDGQAYADGGVTANVLVKLDPRSPQGFLQVWKAQNPGKTFPKVRYWVIINNQMHQRPTTVQLKWPSIAGPSLATAIRSATISEVRWLAAEADFTNVKYGAEIEVRVLAIPDEWSPPVEGDFEKATMNSLADLGRRLGADHTSWQVWAEPGR